MKQHIGKPKGKPTVFLKITTAAFKEIVGKLWSLPLVEKQDARNK